MRLSYKSRGEAVNDRRRSYGSPVEVLERKEHGRLTEANRNTLKLLLRQSTEAGRLRLRGGGRGAWYEVA